jgi:hypothetical protein
MPRAAPCGLQGNNKLVPLHEVGLQEVQHRHARAPYIKHHLKLLQVYQMNDWKLPLGIYLLSINLPGQQNKRRENYKIEMLF